MSGPHYVKEAADCVTVTWSLTGPPGGIQDWTWIRTVNQFQAVLYRDGRTDFNYRDMAVRDAIVGIYPLVAPGAGSRCAYLRLTPSTPAADSVVRWPVST